ncbi:MAG: hypothetical protein BGO09_15705 [Bacteroidetes bacterium 47-18]|nr:MAG: hypothetical protein BGO09_15705 [Bacteroidetes bacterium 47-18]
MNIRPQAKGHTRVHSDALNDILFILLFFFLIVATLANPDVIKLKNPKAQSDTKVKQSITVSIDGNQQLYIGQQTITDAELYEALKEKLAAQPADAEPSIVINADTAANAKQIVAVMSAAQKLKVRTVLAVEKE